MQLNGHSRTDSGNGLGMREPEHAECSAVAGNLALQDSKSGEFARRYVDGQRVRRSISPVLALRLANRPLHRRPASPFRRNPIAFGIGRQRKTNPTGPLWPRVGRSYIVALAPAQKTKKPRVTA
jgi:hypothetical protein